MAQNTQPYKGARDFYPEDKRIQKWMFAKMREVAERFGYQEYDAPIIEPLDIYLLKAGEEIIRDQIYSFTDRGDRKVAIRPEMTPTVSRMVAGRRQELAYPLRLYSIPELWRYERPQKGRLRQHWQLNVDIFGVEGLEADHEVIALADAVLQSYGAKRDSYTIRLNSRRFINHIFEEHLKLDAEKALALSRIVDFQKKISADEYHKLVSEILPEAEVEKLLKLLDHKTLDELPDVLRKHESVAELQKLLKLLADGGVSNAVFDVSIMRGFDYYTDIVFEVFDNNPENNRSMFGGGRYDGLVGEFGVEPVPTVGFGMGDVTLQNFLESHKLLPELKSEVEAVAVLIGDVYEAAQPLLAKLRQKQNLAVDMTTRKLDKKIQSAAKAGASEVIFIGETEIKDNKVRIKNLSSGEEREEKV